MDGTPDEFLERLRSTFRVEAEEHLDAMTSGLLELERTVDSGADASVIGTVFRAAHSLKGAARAADFPDIETLCAALEDTFSSWRDGRRTPTRQVLDAVHRTVDAIRAAVGPQAPVPPAPSFEAHSPDAPSSDPPAAAAEEAATAAVAAAAPMPRPPGARDTVRISMGKLDARVAQAEEMLTAKQIVGRHAGDLQELAGRFDAWRKAWSSVEPQVRFLSQSLERGQAPQSGELGPVLEFLETHVEFMKGLESRVAGIAAGATRDRRTVGSLVDTLLEDAKALLLFPFSALADPFRKLVRDECRAQGKEADMVVRGGDVDIDKRIQEEMKAPLIHLLRNAIDHGIEPVEARRRAGKAARGTIELSASRVNGHQVEIVVSDDGAGIDPVKVREAAVAHGTLSAEEAEALSDSEVARLAFEPGLSTRPTVTSLSGRGLGLAIVREHVQRLGGRVSVESERGRGTRFVIVVPSVLATFRGVLVDVTGRTFVVPTLHVDRVLRLSPGDIATVEGRETVTTGGRTVPIVRLADALELPAATARDEAGLDLFAMVLMSGEQRIAFLVDAIRGEQEVLVKPLRKPLVRVRNVAGATVLTSGEVACVLNVADLLASAWRMADGLSVRSVAAKSGERSEEEPASILLVEDSITSRMLLKGILESAGYKVTTAVDGLEAFALLRTQRFDLVVSDYEMPRLDGIELTARIRSDARLAELPVILVTARESREDRERGIDVGANAYIVKSSFDQSNLLEAVRRLV